MKTLRNFVKLALSGGLLLASGAVLADTATDNLDISITIQAACTLNSLDDLTATHPVGTSGYQTMSGNVSVTCNNGVPYSVAMGAGSNAMGGVRRVNSGANYISYLILKGSTAQEWGTQGTVADTSFGAHTDVNATGTGAATNHGYTVGYTLAGTEATGTYTDQVLVTVEF